MTARVVPLRSAEVIDRRDPRFWMFTRSHRRALQELREAPWLPDYDEKLRFYERLIGGDDPEAA